MRALALSLLALASACTSSPDLVTRSSPATGALWIAHVDVVDVVTGSVARARDVEVRDGLVAAIHPAGVAPAGAIDGRGSSLVPGFIDAHVHIESSADPPWTQPRPEVERNLQRFLYAGVTTVFETGGRAPAAFERRDAVAQGELVGPRIFTTGPLFTAPAGHPIPLLAHGLPDVLEWYVIPRLTRQVSTADEARAAIDELVEQRPDAIKVVVDRIPDGVPMLAPDVVAAIAAHARTRGLRAVAHIGTTTDALSAAESGVSLWVHGVYRERIPDAAIARLAAYRIPMVPTLVVFDAYGRVGRKSFSPTPLEQQTVAAEMLEARDHPPPDVDMPEGGREFLAELAALDGVGVDNVRRLHAAGVVMLAGSDTQSFVYAGPGLHRELALLAQALPPLEVLRAATLNPARFLAQTDDPPFGVIAPGKIADLVLVRGDPLADPAALSDIRAVIARGQRVERHPIVGAP